MSKQCAQAEQLKVTDPYIPGNCFLQKQDIIYIIYRSSDFHMIHKLFQNKYIFWKQDFFQENDSIRIANEFKLALEFYINKLLFMLNIFIKFFAS